MNNNFENLSNQEEISFDIKQEFSYYLFFWPWFLMSVFFCVICSFIYLRYTPNIYKTSAQVQITKSDASSSFLTTEVTSLFGTRVNVDNDISVITSNHILSKVVQQLDLQTTISSIGRVKSSLQFGEEIPFEIKFKNPNYFQNWNLVFSNNSALISNDSLRYKINKNETLENDYFSFNLKNDSLYSKDSEFTIHNSSLNFATSILKKRIIALPGSKNNGEIINISIHGTNKLRNEAILNTLIQVVKADRVSDQRQLSSASIEFIEERLVTLKNSLNSISKRTIEYQLENNIFDSEKQTSTLLSNIVKENEETFNLKIQLEIAISLLEHLNSQQNFEILPANIGIVDLSVNQLLDSYNKLLIERNNLLVSATENSPVIIGITEKLNNIKKANIEGINRYIKNLQVSISRYQIINDKSIKTVSGFPQKGYMMRTLAREFKFTEDLFVFLSQRKEEASISYVSVLPNLKVLSFGISDIFPVSPKKNIIYLGGLFVSIIIPFGILFLLKILDTKINTREDLEKGLKGLTILGEVPFDENYSENDDRSIIAESTRVIRSSMSFLLNQNKPQVIITTSTIKGEGKSFVSYNIAQSYNALGKKVILIGADLRNPQVHTLLGIERGNLGLSTFLNDVNYNDLDKLIVKGKSIDEIDYLLSGAIPPNPSELLMRPRMKELLEILKSSYDLIIIDTAPLLLVSDTTPIITFV